MDGKNNPTNTQASAETTPAPAVNDSVEAGAVLATLN